MGSIAVVGFEAEGQASYEYFSRQGHHVVICDRDQNKIVPEGAETQLGDAYLDGLERFDVILRTPGMRPQIILDKYPAIADKISSGTNEFLKACPTKNVIGVTGTKGKGTTSTLITRMLEAAGKKVFLGGNIGVPALTFIDEVQAGDYVVLELSSFQLIDVKKSPRLAVCLMVVPEHLDWHADLDEYLAAKQQLFRWQTSQDVAIYNPENDYSKFITSESAAQKIPYLKEPGAFVDGDAIRIDGQEIVKTSELKLLGRHNWQNVCAAVTAVWQETQNIEAMRSVLTTFSGLEHRLEFVREFDGVSYYDDSFGTTPETAMVAVEAFEEPKVVILGGSDKGTTFAKLAATVVANNVRAVITIGQMGPVIAGELRKLGYPAVYEGAQNMEEIIACARKLAQPGDIVLLSTGCASFGMFKNYKDRGNQFKQAAKALS